jgi:lysophospholipid acyltransferase (LPLAT)-like uncharacterized protein
VNPRALRLAQGAQVRGFAAYLRLVQRTSLVQVACDVEESALVGFWHDAMFCLLSATLGRKEVALYVRAQPGLRRTLELLSALGVRVFVSDHRGTAGVKEARQWLSVPGRVLAITLDMGVPRTALPGVGRLSRMLGVPLRPLAVTATSGYRLEQWDRCIVPDAGGRLAVRLLDAVDTRTPDHGARALESALCDPALGEGPPRAWGRVLAPWPRACLHPIVKNRLRVWSGGELREISV